MTKDRNTANNICIHSTVLELSDLHPNFSSWGDWSRTLRDERRLVGPWLPDLRNDCRAAPIQGQRRASYTFRHGEKDSDREGGIQRQFQQDDERTLHHGQSFEIIWKQLNTQLSCLKTQSNKEGFLYFIVAADQGPSTEVGLPRLKGERSTVTSFFPKYQLQDAGGRTC